MNHEMVDFKGHCQNLNFEEEKKNQNDVYIFTDIDNCSVKIL